MKQEDKSHLSTHQTCMNSENVNLSRLSCRSKQEEVGFFIQHFVTRTWTRIAPMCPCQCNLNFLKRTHDVKHVLSRMIIQKARSETFWLRAKSQFLSFPFVHIFMTSIKLCSRWKNKVRILSLFASSLFWFGLCRMEKYKSHEKKDDENGENKKGMRMEWNSRTVFGTEIVLKNEEEEEISLSVSSSPFRIVCYSLWIWYVREILGTPYAILTAFLPSPLPPFIQPSFDLVSSPPDLNWFSFS